MPVYHEQLRPGKGRCAVAARPVAAGTRVLQTRALAAMATARCAVCFAAPVEGGQQRRSLRRCGGCRRLRYCSSACQQRDWREGGHARECRAWGRIPASVEDAALPTLLLAARLAASGAHALPQVAQLRAHTEDHTATKLRQFREMALLVRSLLQPPPGEGESVSDDGAPSLDAIVQLFCRINCNAFTISDDAGAPVGIGLFPGGALFNHSCAPNCVVSFSGQEMSVRAIADVEAGEELTISYVELLETTAKRQRALRESYFFDCQCQRCVDASSGVCTDDWYLDGYTCISKGSSSCGLEGVVVFSNEDATSICRKCGRKRTIERRQALEAECDEIDKLLRSRPPSSRDTWQVYQRQREVLVEELGLHPRNARLAKFYRDVGTFLIDCSASAFPNAIPSAPTALEMLTRELTATEWILPAMKLPARGLLHFQLGKVVLAGEQRSDNGSESASKSRSRSDIEKATTHFQKALSILSCAYGPENELVRNVLAHLEEAMWASREA